MSTFRKRIAARRRGAGRSPLTVAVLATVGVLLVVLWQAGMDSVAPFGLQSFEWLTRLTRVDHAIFGVLGLLGVAAWLWAVRFDDAAVDREAMPVRNGPRMTPRRWKALGAGIAILALVALVTQQLFAPQGGFLALLDYSDPGRARNSLTPVGLVAWGACLVLYVYALSDRRRTWRPKSFGPEGIELHVRWEWVALILITALAAYFRLFDLHDLPRQMTSDHTEKLLDVAEILRGQRPVFLPLNAGREPLEFYWIALLVKLGLPLSFDTLKLGMAVVSILTVPLVYWLGREVVDRRVGLLTAMVVALAPWHLQITRIALRIAFSPLFAAAVLALLYRALRRGGRNDWLALGIVFGLGMYGYSGFRPMAFAIPAVVLVRLAHDAWCRRTRGEPPNVLPAAVAGHMASALGAALLVGVPLMRYAIDQPEWFWGRTLSRVTEAETALENPAFLQFLINYKNALLMFNITSDSAWFHSPPGRPALETVAGALLVLGLVTALVRVWRGDWRLGSLILVVPIMLLASAMAIAFPIEVPHLSRAAGALPAVAVLAALPLWSLAGLWRSALGRAGSVVFVVLAAVLFLMMMWGTSTRVFDEYRTSYDNSSLPTREGAEVGEAFVELGGDIEHIYLVSWPYGWDYRALGMQLGDPEWHNVLEGSQANMADAVLAAGEHASDPAPKLYLVGGPIARANIERLLEYYPDAVVVHHDYPVEGKDFWSVYVPPR
jgi:hypothetical protein